MSIALISCEKEDSEAKNITKDSDGNIYNTIVIGTQTWMTENLRTTKYNDATPITLITGNDNWRNMETPAYCWYDNDENYKEPYGAYYNWHTVETGKLCPSGWHVADKEDWVLLYDYLEYNNEKELLFAEDGLNLTAGGYRNEMFSNINNWILYWTPYAPNGYGHAVYFTITPGPYFDDHDSTLGIPVRCVKD